MEQTDPTWVVGLVGAFSWVGGVGGWAVLCQPPYLPQVGMWVGDRWVNTPAAQVVGNCFQLGGQVGGHTPQTVPCWHYYPFALVPSLPQLT